jgi:hypothetical protein
VGEGIFASAPNAIPAFAESLAEEPAALRTAVFSRMALIAQRLDQAKTAEDMLAAARAASAEMAAPPQRAETTVEWLEKEIPADPTETFRDAGALVLLAQAEAAADVPGLTETVRRAVNYLRAATPDPVLVSNLAERFRAESNVALSNFLQTELGLNRAGDVRSALADLRRHVERAEGYVDRRTTLMANLLSAALEWGDSVEIAELISEVAAEEAFADREGGWRLAMTLKSRDETTAEEFLPDTEGPGEPWTSKVPRLVREELRLDRLKAAAAAINDAPERFFSDGDELVVAAEAAFRLATERDLETAMRFATLLEAEYTSEVILQDLAAYSSLNGDPQLVQEMSRTLDLKPTGRIAICQGMVFGLVRLLNEGGSEEGASLAVSAAESAEPSTAR